jgi:diazepam-binding inhibitor (GABA receptor modulator, acyl-CoA-binding protein)
MEKEFNDYAEKLKSSDLKLDNENLLILYGYYKQTTVGDCDISKPSFFDVKGTSKYDAWKENEGMEKKTAMQRYIRKAKTLLKK